MTPRQIKKEKAEQPRKTVNKLSLKYWKLKQASGSLSKDSKQNTLTNPEMTESSSSASVQKTLSEVSVQKTLSPIKSSVSVQKTLSSEVSVQKTLPNPERTGNKILSKCTSNASVQKTLNKGEPEKRKKHCTKPVVRTPGSFKKPNQTNDDDDDDDDLDDSFDMSEAVHSTQIDSPSPSSSVDCAIQHSEHALALLDLDMFNVDRNQNDDKIAQDEQYILDLIAAETSKLTLLKEKKKKDDKNKKEEAAARREIIEKEKKEKETALFLERKRSEANEEKAAAAKTARLLELANETKKMDKILPVLSNFQGTLKNNNLSRNRCLVKCCTISESFSVLRRNARNQHEGIHSLSQKMDILMRQQSELSSLCKDVMTTVTFMSKQMLKSGVEISAFFPIKNDQDMNKFLSNDDGKFDLRAAEFETMLYGAFNPITNPDLTQNSGTFTNALIGALFSREYIDTHRWPTTT